jgi:uncharacterized protein
MKAFYGSFLVTLAVIAGATIWEGPAVAALVLILGILEVSLSFDNAVINATILKRMSQYWQKLFLTVGIVIAVVGMRLLFPIIIVAITARTSPARVVDMALNNPSLYESNLTSAHPAIAAFGGIFLLMIALDFLLEERENPWIAFIEKPFAKLGGVEAISICIAIGVLLASAEWLAGDHHETVLLSGLAGLLAYLSVNGLAGFFEVEADEDDDEVVGISGSSKKASGAMAVVGKAAFFLFLYLEVLDASFSFDGVIGAFAVSNKIFIISAGLGIGALFVRSLTVYLVRQGTLDEYEFLEHGAHYAIGALAIILFATLKYEVPDILTGLIGVGFITLAFISSVNSKKSRERVT